MKIDSRCFSKFSMIPVIGLLALSAPAVSAQDSSIIFEDDFEQHYLGDVPGAPWTNSAQGEGIGVVRTVSDSGGRFDADPTNQILEWKTLESGGTMALQAFNVFEIGADTEIVTVSFDFLDSGWTRTSPFVSLFLYANGGTSSAYIAQRITIGRETIGNADYAAARVVRADIVFNSSYEPLVYRDGEQTLQPGYADIWLDGELAGTGYRHANHATLGGITGFQLNSGGSAEVVVWFDNFVVRNEPFVREVPESSKLFADDFNFHPENAEPGAPWTHVFAGEGRGSMRTIKDAGDLFGFGAENQILEYIGDGTASPMNLQARYVFPEENAPEIGTFSFRFYEPDVESGKGVMSLYAYMDNVHSTNVTHRLIFGGGRVGGYTYGYDRAVQVDYVVNASAEALVYREGERTLPSGLADVWVDGVLAVEGLETGNSNLGGLRSFQLVNNTSDTPLIYIDDFVFRNEAYVTGSEEPEVDVYRAWQEEHFTESELADPAISGDEADPDGDGIPNLLEYALGSNPREASVENLPFSAVREVEGEDYLTLEFRKRDEAEGLDYRVEVSADLVNWNHNGDGTGEIYTEIVEETPEAGSTRVVVRDASPVRETERRFLRLRVSRNGEGL